MGYTAPLLEEIRTEVLRRVTPSSARSAERRERIIKELNMTYATTTAIEDTKWKNEIIPKPTKA